MGGGRVSRVGCWPGGSGKRGANPVAGGAAERRRQLPRHPGRGGHRSRGRCRCAGVDHRIRNRQWRPWRTQPVPVDHETLRTIAAETGGPGLPAPRVPVELRGVYRDLGSSLGYRLERTEITSWAVGARPGGRRCSRPSRRCASPGGCRDRAGLPAARRRHRTVPTRRAGDVPAYGPAAPQMRRPSREPLAARRHRRPDQGRGRHLHRLRHPSRCRHRHDHGPFLARVRWSSPSSARRLPSARPAAPRLSATTTDCQSAAGVVAAFGRG